MEAMDWLFTNPTAAPFTAPVDVARCYCRLKDFRRIVTRCHRLSRSFFPASAAPAPLVLQQDGFQKFRLTIGKVAARWRPTAASARGAARR